jgi:transposase
MMDTGFNEGNLQVTSETHAPDDTPDDGAGRVDRDALRRMHAQKMTLRAMSEELGVSRERVRQVIRKMGLKSKLQMIKERNTAILEESASGNATDEELAAKYDVSPASIALIRRQHGFGATEYRSERLLSAIQAVMDGMSIRMAASEYGVSPGTLAGRLDKTGVKSTYGRWGALKHRYDVIPEMLRDGKTWHQIIDRLSEIERRKIRYETLRIWIANHLVDIDMPGSDDSKDHSAT